MLAPISHSLVIEAPPDAVFDLFANKLGEWWPLPFTFSGVSFQSAIVEPRAGGRWLERTREGEEIAWGDVHAYEPGRRLVLGFAIGADRRPMPRENASEVEVRFIPAGEGTRVEVEHRNFERHGEGAEILRSGMDSRQGWPIILAELRRAAERARPK